MPLYLVWTADEMPRPGVWRTVGRAALWSADGDRLAEAERYACDTGPGYAVVHAPDAATARLAAALNTWRGLSLAARIGGGQ